MGWNDNWYLALELRFDPTPEADQDVIAAKITEKVAFWSQNAGHAGKGTLYMLYRDKAEDMRKDLADPVKRQKMAEEARELTFGPLDRALLQASVQATKPISSETAARIASLRQVIASLPGVSVDHVVRRAKELNITVAEPDAGDPAEFKTLFESYHTKKPNQYGLFEGFRAHLDALDAADLYAFLTKATPTLLEVGDTSPEAVALVETINGAKDLRDVPTVLLHDAAEALSKAFVSKMKTEEKTRATVGKYCVKVFSGEVIRKDYDVYLAFLARRAAINEVVEHIDKVHEGRCPRDYAEGCVATLDQHIGDRVKATGLFIALCRVKGFKFDLPEEDLQSVHKSVVCRCSCVNDLANGASICIRCGEPLHRKCPKCARQMTNVHNYCTCGFDFFNIARAGTAAKQARSLLAKFDLTRAKAALSEAHGLYAEHPEIAAVAAAIGQMERELGDQLGEINRQVTNLNYHRARNLLGTLRATRTGFDNPSLSALVADQIRVAESHLAAARAESDPVEILRLCKQAFAVCHDLPGLQELVARHTDLPIEALSVNDAVARDVSAAVVNGKVVVRMKAPGEGENGIVVAYRFDTFPTSPRDAQAVVKEFHAQELRQEGLLRLELAQKHTYYVTVFLKFAVGERELYSPGTQVILDLASKVVLTYFLAKRRFSSSLSIEIVADQPISHIPEIGLVWLASRAPVYEESCHPIATIPAQSVQFPFTFSTQLPSLPKNAFVKPFVHDAPSFQLKLASNSTNKIT